MKFGVRLGMDICSNNTGVRVQKPLEFPFWNLISDKIHLRKDVEMGYFEHDHGRHCREGACEEFGLVYHKGGFEQVSSTKRKVMADTEMF